MVGFVPDQYLTYNKVVDRVIDKYRVDIDIDRLTVLNKDQLICIYNKLPKDKRIINTLIQKLDDGCSVKRGFNVSVDDHVSISDQVLMFPSEGQNFIILIEDIMYPLDIFDPYA